MEETWLDDGIRVTDAAKNTVVVETEGWSPGGDPPSVAETLAAVQTGPDDPNLVTSGVVERLRYPLVTTELIEIDGRDRLQLATEEERLGGGSYLLRADANVRLFVRFDGPASVRLTTPTDGDRRYELQFPTPTPVSMAFESRVDVPDETVTVPPTPEGTATALSVTSVANETTSPDRTWPTLRNQPPRIELGDETDVPASVRRRRPDTGIELVVPPDLRYLFTGASLIHYLGAAVRTESGADPRLLVDGQTEPLDTLPSYQEQTASLLARCFYLDCVARSAGPHGERLTVAWVFDELGLDAERLYEAPLAERVQRYLAVPFEQVADAFPPWHFSMYVAPRVEHVPTLPHLLQDVPHFFLPSADDLSEAEWLELSSNDGFARELPTPPADGRRGDQSARGTPDPSTERPSDQSTEWPSDQSTERPSDQSSGDAPDHPDDRDGLRRVTREVSNVDLVQPELGPGQEHGWLAEDVPIEVFKTFPEAYENRQKYLDDEDARLTVAAVLNDAEMRAEHDRAIEHYRDRAEELNIDITVAENVEVAELARTFEQRHDLVHFIGHRDPEGLECADGYLSTSSLAESNARTFFLNACGSYPEGRELIRRGSIAGGVTFESVLDSEAARVGTTFARLIVLGFSVKRGLDYARRQLLMPKDYAVVGDGSHVVAQNDSLVPPKRWLFEVDADTFRIVAESLSMWSHGGYTRSTLLDDPDDRYLFGTDRVYTVSRAELDEYLSMAQSPIVYDQQLRWPTDLREEIIG